MLHGTNEVARGQVAKSSRSCRGRGRRLDISSSDDESQTCAGEASNCRARALSFCTDSHSYQAGPASGLENSQASLNKRLASIAGLDAEHGRKSPKETGPKDFSFLLRNSFEGGTVEDSLASPVLRPQVVSEASVKNAECSAVSRSSTCPSTVDKQEAPALIEDDDGSRWIRSDVKTGADLINGQAWIAEFSSRFEKARAEAVAATGAAPSGAASGPVRDLPLRNRILKQMAGVSAPGRKVRLSTGEDVIFWFNVGAPGPPQSRVYVTEATCPHQHVCLLGGELTEIEDLVGGTGRHAIVRCPRHNKSFNLRTGESRGHAEKLRTYPHRFQNGYMYVCVDRGHDLGCSDDVGATAPDTPKAPSVHLGPGFCVAEPPSSEKSRVPAAGPCFAMASADDLEGAHVVQVHKRQRTGRKKSDAACVESM
eukprot:gnl/TRDRNA2_/TRDRNA2_188677_c0_seq1.p1 gnl/TRDRNA2_/TRDRNA2_188677_c0~~gnl/TRDRNA2_/TRDRNA2_188677_c0_seq1.p1  ORF type:complete len:425 (+),score=57.69 gnl/TRDRNA2_/TRDRNA2_188677_c0_seq1:31-1305(+)